MKYNVLNGLKNFGKYVAAPIAAGTLIAIGLGDVKKPPQYNGFFNTDFSELKIEYDNDIGQLFSAYNRGEGKEFHTSESFSKAYQIFMKNNPQIENILTYKGKVKIPDLNRDGKVLGKKVNSPETNQRGGK